MPTAPPTRCGDPGCGDLATYRARCDTHQPPPWRGRAPKQERYGMSSGALRNLKRRVASRDHGCCYLCGGEADDGETMELEHLTPVADGGATADLDNLGLAHPACHAAKTAAENDRRTTRARAARRQT